MAKYNIAETTKVTGLCFDFVYGEADVQNGSLVAKGDLAEGERNIYTAEIPTATSELFLVAEPAWSYDDSRLVNQNEENFINEAGKPFRVYGLKTHDKFGIEDYGFGDDAENIAVGSYVVTAADNTFALTVSGTDLPDASVYGFIGKIVEIEEYGFAYATGSSGDIGATGRRVIIEVVRNETIL